MAGNTVWDLCYAAARIRTSDGPVLVDDDDAITAGSVPVLGGNGLDHPLSPMFAGGTSRLGFVEVSPGVDLYGERHRVAKQAQD